MPEHKASCQCGALSITASADPDFVIACNCKACQKRTGSAFGAGAYFKRSDSVVTGAKTNWSRAAAAGREIENSFCPTCGTALLWRADLRPDHIGVALGCFDTPPPAPIRVIWTEEQHDWVAFPQDWPTFPQGTPPPEK